MGVILTLWSFKTRGLDASTYCHGVLHTSQNNGKHLSVLILSDCTTVITPLGDFTPAVHRGGWIKLYTVCSRSGSFRQVRMTLAKAGGEQTAVPRLRELFSHCAHTQRGNHSDWMLAQRSGHFALVFDLLKVSSESANFVFLILCMHTSARIQECCACGLNVFSAGSYWGEMCMVGSCCKVNSIFLFTQVKIIHLSKL